jgi:adenylosuccinate synthase
VVGIRELKIGTHYTLHGKVLPPSRMPAGLEDLAAVKVEYMTMPGWEQDISTCKSVAELPAAARAYLKAIQDLLGVPISWVGIGPDREDMMVVSI